jgi:hypothetical protein
MHQESYEAGRRYGKAYRKTHREWLSDSAIASRAALDWIRAEADFGSHVHDAFYWGVIEGLRPFQAADFAATFERNAQAAIFKAQASLGGARFSVATNDHAHYQKTLAHWRALGASIIEEETQHESRTAHHCQPADSDRRKGKRSRSRRAAAGGSAGTLLQASLFQEIF